MPINSPYTDLTFTLLLTILSSRIIMWQFLAHAEDCTFNNSNFTRAHIAQLVEHFHGKEEVVCSIHTVGTKIIKLSTP